MIVDLFAGPGGWDEGLRVAGARDLIYGLENDRYACDTAIAAGHQRIQVDVEGVDSWRYLQIRGLVASPPCQAFSQGGHGEGYKEKARRVMLDHIYECRSGWVEPTGILCEADIRADLTLQPLKWTLKARPRWVAFEQVPVVATHWYAMCEVLAGAGYDAQSRVMSFADFGLPQLRERAILLASRTQEVAWPEPTHQDLRHHDSLFDDGLAPWVSIGEALGVSGDHPTLQRPSATVTGGGGKDNGTGIFLDKDFRYKLRDALDRPTGGLLSPSEAGVLQGFRPDYPWHGPLGDQYMQIGNAMPPTMAALLLEQFLGT